MPTTYEPIATTTLSNTQNSVSFTSIGGTYTDLIIVVSPLTNNTSADDVYIQYNSDTGSNYSQTGMRGNGSAASSSRALSQAQIFTTLTASAGSTTDPRTTIIQIMNYSNTTTYKTILGRASAAETGAEADVGLWQSTSAINQIDITTATTNDFASGSVITLYGIASA